MRKLIVSCSVLALLLVAANAAVAATPERWDGVSHYETRLGVFFHCGCGEKSLGRTGSKVNAYFQLGEDGKTWFYIGDDQNGYHECECGNDVWWNGSNQSGKLDGSNVKCVGVKGNGGGGGGCDCGCGCDGKDCGCDCGCGCGNGGGGGGNKEGEDDAYGFLKIKVKEIVHTAVKGEAQYAEEAIGDKVLGKLIEGAEKVYRIQSLGSKAYSHVNPLSGAVLPDGVSTDTWLQVANGKTFIRVDLAKLAEAGDAGFDIGLADDKRHSPGQGIIDELWNKSLGYTYNVKLDGGDLVITCELYKGKIVAGLADSENFKKNAQNNSFSKESKTGKWAIPAKAIDEGIVDVYVEIKDDPSYVTDELLGWAWNGEFFEGTESPDGDYFWAGPTGKEKGNDGRFDNEFTGWYEFEGEFQKDNDFFGWLYNGEFYEGDVDEDGLIGWLFKDKLFAREVIYCKKTVKRNQEVVVLDADLMLVHEGKGKPELLLGTYTVWFGGEMIGDVTLSDEGETEEFEMTVHTGDIDICGCFDGDGDVVAEDDDE